jgi:hypothetical protein
VSVVFNDLMINPALTWFKEEQIIDKAHPASHLVFLIENI